MATLEINGTEQEAKFNFMFSKKAKEKYAEADKDGNPGDGFHSVYMGLLEMKPESLVAFWDCALASLKGKDKPKVEDIEAAIEARIEEDEDTLDMFKEAYRAIDESGFFKQQSKKLWSNLAMLQNKGKTDEEKEENQEMYQYMVKSREMLTE